MAWSKKKITFHLLAAVASGVLLYLSLPPVDIGYLAWVAFIPLFISIGFLKNVASFFIAFLMGFTFFVLHVSWINSISGVPFIAFLASVCYGAVFYGLFGFFFAFVIHRTRWPAILISPTLWVALEYFKSNLSFFAIPYGLAGHTQHNLIPIIQIASFTSVYGISFLIVLVNTTLAEMLCGLASPDELPRFSLSSFSKRAIPILGILIAVFLWGNHQVRTLNSNQTKILTVSLIQGNIPQKDIWDPNQYWRILGRYQDMTLQAYFDSPDLIVWPESSTPGYLTNSPMAYLKIRNLIKATSIPILLGSSSYAKGGNPEKKVFKKLNSAFFMRTDGNIPISYNKIKPVPFWEFLPLEGRFSWPKWLVPKHGTTIPGRRYEVFRLQDTRFGAIICWENLFPELCRNFVNNGAQFMVNLTNEAIFGETAAPRQIMAMSVFRAVENRVALLRCANTGISCLIDPVGRVRAKVQDENGKDLMVTGTLTVSVPESQGPTFYTKHGDVFAIACMILASLAFISALLPFKVRKLLRIEKP